MWIYGFITNMNLGKFHHDLTTTEPWNHGEYWKSMEILPFYGPTIQVSEILFHLPRFTDV